VKPLTKAEINRHARIRCLKERHALTSRELAEILPGGERRTVEKWVDGELKTPLLPICELWRRLEGKDIKTELEEEEG